MDRREWLRDRRAAVRQEYDAEAPTYDAHPYPAPLHAALVDRLLARCPPAGRILDAPCGTGRYFAQVVASGRTVTGVDESAGMLEVARSRGTADRLILGGLQEMAFETEFDAAMTIDAMENVPPEDWPLVLSNLHRALRPGGHLYLTVEEIAESAIATAYRDGLARGLPLVSGEVIEGDVAGYHYYPGEEHVERWLAGAGFEIVEQDRDPQGEWAYWHLICRADAARRRT